MKNAPEPPPDLDEAGKKLWRDVLADAPDDLALDARERSLLGNACGQADTNAALEEQLNADGLTVRGASGQWRLNAAATELRQGRLALAKLLGEVCLDRVQRPVEDDELFPDWLTAD